MIENQQLKGKEIMSRETKEISIEEEADASQQTLDNISIENIENVLENEAIEMAIA